MLCTKEHRYLTDFTALPESQDNQNGDRHICAGCAYVEGLIDGLSGAPKKCNLSHLPESQAGTVRHKGAFEAYAEAYEKGRKLSS